jgi:pilus assembly protein Flp/PilA
MLSYLRKVTRDAVDRGASAVEYGLMVAAIAAVIVGVVMGLGSVVQRVFQGSCTAISGAAPPPAPGAPAPPAPPAC